MNDVPQGGLDGVAGVNHSPGYYVVSVLAFLSIILSIYLWMFQLSALIYSYFHFHRWKGARVPDEPGVTILKPLRFAPGGGTNTDTATIKSNLETFFNLSYKNYELIFCIKYADDLAADIVKALMNAYPHINAKLLIGGEDVGVNPKINNMQKGYASSNDKFKYIWICDAGIRVHKDVLAEMMSLIERNSNVGLVHQLPFTHELSRGASYGNVIEKIYFGSQHGRIQVCAHLMGQVCITGMSNLIRKSALEKSCGGLIGLASYMAEDYFMTKRLESAGYTFLLSSFPAQQNQNNVTVKSFFDRMTRWSQLRLTMIPGVTCIEPFSEIILSTLLTSLAISWWFPHVPKVIFIFLNIALWFLADVVLITVLNNGFPKTPLSKLLFCWLVRETSTLYILTIAIFRSRTTWFGGSYRIGLGGKAERVVDELNSLT